MTDAELRAVAERIVAKAALATPEPWRVSGMTVFADPVGDWNRATCIRVADTYFHDAKGRERTNNADFIVAARQDAVALARAVLARLDAARDERAKSRRESEHDAEAPCPVCGKAP
jgi:hypothetical protein